MHSKESKYNQGSSLGLLQPGYQCCFATLGLQLLLLSGRLQLLDCHLGGGCWGGDLKRTVALELLG